MNIETEHRPWGSYTRFTDNEPTTVKIITVNPSEELSLQYHEQRSEFWKIISGNPLITVGETVTEAFKGDEFFVPEKTQHRIKAQEEAVELLEISFGEFDEADITRLEDKYGRS